MPIDINYDPRADRELVNKESLLNGDDLLTTSLRKFSQYWLDSDYEGAIDHNKAAIPPITPDSKYADTVQREDIESPEAQILSTTQFPDKGMQLREDYVMYAHYFRMSLLLPDVASLNLFTEQESGIRAAIMSVFSERVLDKKCRHFYVNLLKNVTRDQKEQAARVGTSILKNACSAHDFSREETYLALTEDALGDAVAKGKWKDMWFRFPIPSYAEVSKEICHITEFIDDVPSEIAFIARYATTLPIDNFFQV